MSGIAIVAIPAEDDPVWKYSSEKVPHMTLLFLGDGPLANEENIVQYIQHVADDSLTRFHLSVDHRGLLGPDDADVVFFDKQSWNFGKILAARGFLLANDDIKAAYDSAEQFDGWTPHLTMGFPATPAHPDEREYPGISGVQFDRIAIWLDNYDGPEFLLKKDDYRGEVMPEAYQSALNKLAEKTLSEVELSEEELAHFGRLGMKWGVRRQTDSSGLVKGSVAGAIKGGQTPRAGAKAVKALTKGKASSDHKQMVKNLDKNVEHLSTAEIRELTSRIQAIKSFKAETAAQAAAKKSVSSKLLAFALNEVREGAKNATSAYIKELTGENVKGLLQTVKATKTQQAKTQKERQKAEAHDLKMKAQAEKDAKEAANKAPKDDSTPKPSSTPDRQLAIETLAQQIARTQNG